MRSIFLFLLTIVCFAANGTTYYVSPTGNDATGNGSVASPWASLHKACSSVTAAGSIIHIMSGTYVDASQCTVAIGVSIEGEGASTHIKLGYYNSGTQSAAAIMLVSATEGTNGNQSITNIWFDVKDSCSIGILVKMRSNVTIHECTFTNFYGSAVYFNGRISTGAPVVYAIGNQYYNNISTDCCDRQKPGGAGGVLGIAGQDGMLIYDNTFNQLGRPQTHNGDCIGAVQGYNRGIKYYNNVSHKPLVEGGSNNFCIEEWYDRGGWEIYGNTFDGGGNAIDIGVGGANKMGYSYSFYIHDNLFTASSQIPTFPTQSQAIPSMGVQFETEDNPTSGNAIICNNHFVNVCSALQITQIHGSSEKITNVNFHNNLIENAGYADSHSSGQAINMALDVGASLGIDSIFIDNNTIIGGTSGKLGSGIYIRASTGLTVSHVFIRNNIIENVANYGYVTYDGAGTINTISLQNNNAYNNAHSNSPFNNSSASVTYIANSGNMTSSPLLDLACHLTSTSPGKGGGINVGYGTDIGAFPYSTLNKPPVANAGPDQTITLPTNSVTLAGKGSDPDGTISSYGWSKISGPTSFDITNPTMAGTTVTGLAQGIYQFQLTVTDSLGAIGKDTIQVIVKPANIPPIANAGQDQTITLPTNSLTLSGSGSDSDGTISSYNWIKVSGPSSYTIVNVTSPGTSVTGLVQGIYQFRLTVTDNNGTTGSDTIQVTVNAVPNQPPVANAGSDQTITLPVNSAILTGSGIDPDGTISSYNWTKISGPSSGTISNKNLASTSVTGLVQGIYQFQLTVTDNNGATGTDEVLITVNPAANIPPIANAGSDQTITLPVNSITLSGGGSDADGTVVSYNWTQISGPSGYSIVNASLPGTNVTGLVQGVYQFQLQVTDNSGAIGTDIVQVTVNAAANIPPAANAGSDQMITLPVNTITLSGSGSDADGTVVSYTWTQISGPSGYNIVNASSPVTDVTGLVQGVYQFQLQVTDNSGAIGMATMQVIVNAAPNQPPLANAGPDQSITLPVNTLTLSGSGNDADGTVVGYSWTQISGPLGYNIVNANSPVTDVSGLTQGIYKFQLTVTDNNGATGTDLIIVTVNAATNIPPVADAGPDQSVTLPVNSITLSGSGNDADGTIVSYTWAKISGPSSYTIVSINSAVTNVTGLVQGVYQFQLQVTDNSGAIGTDIIQVTVNPGANIPPVANAGTDQSVTLPVNSVTLSGSGSDADGTVVSYTWTQISGPSGYNIVSANSIVTDVTGLMQGVYQFQLQVTDNEGAVGADIVQVTVNAVPNQPPVANAGSDQTITLPVNSAILTGSGIDPDGTISSYNWTKISGPSSGTISNKNLASTSVTGLVQGIYQFQLTVTDNNGATGTDEVLITVNPAANIPPIANAGSDQTITLPVNSITLSGGGSDADGTVVSYNWTQISGPSGYSIVNASLPDTNVTGLVQGVYQFQLQVTDNSGAIGTDIVQVTVNAAANIPPAANAGSDQMITLPVNTITLSGSGSDADGTVVSYTWTQISGPSGYNIVNASSPVTDVTGLVQGVYQFQLQVTDNSGAIGMATMQVTVNGTVNIPPVANAGSDQTITLPIDSVVVSGSGSDADGVVVSYLWTKIAGPGIFNIVNSTSPSTSITGLLQGVYSFVLQVTDDNGVTSGDTMQITVNAATNTPPVANAGSDQSITLPVNSTTLSGSGNDADGTIVSYTWAKISGPSSYTIVSINSAVTNVTGLVQGVYQFVLKVTDNDGASGTDTMQVTVNIAGNISPVANAGPDKAITLPTSSVTFNGSGSDADGTVVGYLWTHVSGPSSYNIVNATSSSTTITGLAEGVYQFQLQVTDNNGATGTDIVRLTVKAAPNVPPVANAGSDLTVTLPTNSLIVSGSGTDADGTVVSYQWTKISGPSSYSIVNPNSASTNINGLVKGSYKFQLKVTDNNGASGTDIVRITVNAAANIAPIADAGSDWTITLPANTLTVTGSGTDADGIVSSYQWTKISGPSSYTIVNATSAVTNITGLVQGVYQFQLRVTDNNGATGTDIMQVTVNAALNVPPVANAGLDKTITLPTNSLTVTGSGSDADGTVAGYQWKKISGPASYTIINANAATTDITGLTEGVYQFELTVTDNNGATGTDVMQVTVNAAPNQPPVANAGADQTITLPTNSLTVSGSGTDVDGTVVSYQWTRISGPSSYNIVSATSAVTNITGLIQGVYQFQLTVIDNSGATGTDIMQITVNAAPNQPPVANAGSNQTITLPINSLIVSGSGTDADGTVVSYQWTKISGPSSYSIINATSAVTNITGLIQGVYQFQLKVTDNNGASGTDIVRITVNAAANIAPIADAGSDWTITLPVNSLTVTGSGTDADGIVSSYQWTKISGPSSYTIVNATSAVTNIAGLVQGVYQFQLRVTDNNGATGTDIMQVTVNAALNVPPVANAGSDKTITLPTNSLTVTGSGSDADGTVAGYQWKKISGPASYTIINANAATTDIAGLTEGVYQFELTVTDNNGATGTDVMQVTVNAAPNQPPVANAGADQTITLPTNSLTVSGSGTDVDGTVVSYQWTRISGPSSYNIVSATSAVTNITGLIQGVYQFQLTVIDNSGATGTDIMQITVNAAPNQPPVANAGSNQTITLPINSLIVSGSGTDADGTVVSYQWTKISGPSNYSIINATSAVTNITGLIQGVYQFQLKVTDNNGASGTDIVRITVNAAANIAPVAAAGSDQTINLPTNLVTVSGNGNDRDGTIVGYQWTKISGPATYNIVNSTNASTVINGLVEGVYLFELRVTDNNGARGRDTIQITVNAAVNIAPTAHAGADIIITLPVNTVSLAGSGSDADGTIVSYQWTKISGPSTYNITNSSSPITDASGLVEGVYKFEIQVNDNSGAIGRDTIQVTVNAPNVPPIADAGNDQTITLPTNSVTLSGSGSDSDGTITGYSWVQVSGPSLSVIASSNNVITFANDLAGGTYEFELTVTDNKGATGKDTVAIVVAEPRLNSSLQSNIITAYPNPVVDMTTLEINTTDVYSKLFVLVRDMQGHIVYKNEITPSQSDIKQIIDMSNLAKGTYLITVYFSDKQKNSIKVIRL